MAKVFSIDANEFIEKLAKELQNNKEIKAPDWAKFAKTGVHKEKPPARKDWWHVRAAAVLRSIYKLGPIGTSKLRTKYGGRKNNGMSPEHHRKGSGSVIRKVLQQLEDAKLIKKVEKGKHKGREITAEGMKLLSKIAGN